MHAVRTATALLTIAAGFVASAGDAALTTTQARSGAETERGTPDTVYFFDMRGRSSSERELMASLAGLVNRTPEEIIMIGEDSQNSGSPEFWLRQYLKSHDNVAVRYKSDIAEYLEHFKPGLVEGYIYYDRATDPDSVNVAATLAGVKNAIIADMVTEPIAKKAGLKKLADATKVSPEEVYDEYQDEFSKDYYVNQLPDRTPYLLDIAVMQRAFMSWESPDRDKKQYPNMNPGARVLGFGAGEFNYFSLASRHGLSGAPSDWLLSGSSTMALDVPIEKQKTHTSPKLKTEDGVHYVSFVMSDGDNIQWLCRGFATDQKFFGSPHRGEFNMTWDLSPELADVNPVAVNYLYEHASQGETRDFFVTASGRGMAYPSMLPDPQHFADDTADAMKSVDHNIISVLDPDYDLDSLYPLLEKPEVMGMMLKTFGGAYRELGGQIFWHEGKPIVSVKHTLWSAIQEPEEITRLLNEGPKNPLTNQGSYTIVNVHPWSNFPVGGDPMSALSWINDHLNDDVRVVPLDELIIHLRQNFGKPVESEG